MKLDARGHAHHHRALRACETRYAQPPRRQGGIPLPRQRARVRIYTHGIGSICMYIRAEMFVFRSAAVGGTLFSLALFLLFLLSLLRYSCWFPRFQCWWFVCAASRLTFATFDDEHVWCVLSIVVAGNRRLDVSAFNLLYSSIHLRTRYYSCIYYTKLSNTRPGNPPPNNNVVVVVCVIFSIPENLSISRLTHRLCTSRGWRWVSRFGFPSAAAPADARIHIDSRAGERERGAHTRAGAAKGEMRQRPAKRIAFRGNVIYRDAPREA